MNQQFIRTFQSFFSTFLLTQGLIKKLEDIGEQAKGHKYAAHATCILGKSSAYCLVVWFLTSLFFCNNVVKIKCSIFSETSEVEKGVQNIQLSDKVRNRIPPSVLSMLGVIHKRVFQLYDGVWLLNKKCFCRMYNLQSTGLQKVFGSKNMKLLITIGLKTENFQSHPEI